MTALMERIRQEHRSIAEEVSQLFKETQIFLSDITVERHKQAKKQAEELFKFHQNLQQENREFLTATEQQRMTKAQEQSQRLRQFRRELFISIFGMPSSSPSPKRPTTVES